MRGCGNDGNNFQMDGTHKLERIRDPLHNLIEFNTRDQLERVLWKVIQTRPFQRLRRIHQLGFSEMVYPGATHTRFAHSIGVFHTARHLVRIIDRHAGRGPGLESQAKIALAAALVHDVGHGMFSHAFEDVAQELKLAMSNHEEMSARLIRDGEICQALNSELGSGFAHDVANLITNGPRHLYDAVVSSQFDADRLDYMQRDRLMTGVQNSGIDFAWLLANLEIGDMPTGTDEKSTGKIQTLVLGPKATHAAETYVLALFQLYPTVYFHKTTRATEKVFSTLMCRLIGLARDGQSPRTGLPKTHPLIRFAMQPDDLENALALDDAVFLGSLPMLTRARDPQVKLLSERLEQRRLPKCIDIRNRLAEFVPVPRPGGERKQAAHKKQIGRMVGQIEDKLRSWSSDKSGDVPRILLDRAKRNPYKRVLESKGPLNQMRIRCPDGTDRDMAESSAVVAALETFELFRAYVDGADHEAGEMIEKTVTIVGKEASHAGA